MHRMEHGHYAWERLVICIEALLESWVHDSAMFPSAQKRNTEQRARAVNINVIMCLRKMNNMHTRTR
jgi:hypothetical protein